MHLYILGQGVVPEPTYEVETDKGWQSIHQTKERINQIVTLNLSATSDSQLFCQNVSRTVLFLHK